MPFIQISPDVSSVTLAPLAMSIHHATGGMPVVIKSKNHSGIIVENGTIDHAVYQSEVLDQVFGRQGAMCLKASKGKYAGMSMFASAILDHFGEPVAAIGIIDATGLLTLKELMDFHAHINLQLQNI